MLLKLFPPLFAAQEVVRLSSPVENKSRAKEDDFLVGDAKGLSGKLCFVLQATKLQLCKIDHCARKKKRDQILAELECDIHLGWTSLSSLVLTSARGFSLSSFNEIWELFILLLSDAMRQNRS